MEIKAWVVVKDGHIKCHFSREQAAAAHANLIGGTAVELTGEMPDPPHEWKVGDWALNPYGYPVQILMINLGAVVFWYLDEGVWADVIDVEVFATWKPCEAPAWFSEDLGPGDLDNLSWEEIRRPNG